MIDIDEAYQILFDNIRPLETVELPISEALFRTLARPVVSDVDDPPFDRAVMDGYAVRADDLAAAPVSLRVTGQVRAGTMPTGTVESGEAMQINTGAPVPAGADAVVRVERTGPGERDGTVRILEGVKRGNFITPRAAHASVGDVILSAGCRMTPLAIGGAVAAGAATVTVYRRPRVAILPTGDELVDVAQKPTAAQIRDSNRYLVRSLVVSAHADALPLPVAADDRGALKERITAGLQADVLCMTGGISMGEYDFVPGVLEELGARFHIHKMAIKPGRPTIFATMPDGTLVFALPGNPASAFVGFELLVRPALAALEGRPGMTPPGVRATLRGTVQPTRDRRTYLPARARVTSNGGWEVEPVSWHGSGDGLGMAAADALIVRSPNAEAVQTGDAVLILLVDRA